MKRILVVSMAALSLTPGVALAAHGKAGLWNVTSTMSMPNMPQMPPEAMAMMKARGIKMPGVEPVTNQMCMTQADVDSDVPPRTSDREENCQTHVLSKTASSISVDLVCTGRLNGTGHTQISYSGAEHYTGSYHFKGVVEGNPSELTTNFKADWVKSDCGAVKPYVHKTQ